MAGSIAGVVEHTFMFPVDTLKTHRVRPVRQGRQAGFRHREQRLGRLRPRAQVARQRRGVARLWRGVGTMFAGCIPAHAAYFSIYEFAKDRTGANLPGHAGGCGVLGDGRHAGARLTMTPMDTVKQRLQLGYYRNIPHCISHMARAEGMRSFFVSPPRP